MDQIGKTKFWEIIENSKKHGTNFDNRLEYMISSLASEPETGILDFEKSLRKALLDSSNYDVMAVLYLIDGSVSDDSFLYFRCRLIAEGRGLFTKIIQNADVLAETEIDYIYLGEGMLYVADEAFKRKFGSQTDKELPRDVCADYLDYNIGYEISGEDWDEGDLPSRFPKLVAKYDF